MPSRPSTAKCVTPDSNQMSTMFFSFSNVGAAARGHAKPGGKIRLDRIAPPRARAHFAETLRAASARRADRGSTRRTRVQIERRNRRTPRALARDAPLGMGFDHLRLPRFAPLGRIRDGVDGVDAALAQQVLIHRDEPLRGRAEDHRIVAAPAVRIRMFEFGVAPQRAARAQIVDDLRCWP